MDRIALSISSTRGALVGKGATALSYAGALADVWQQASGHDAAHNPRFVVWSARTGLAGLVSRGHQLGRTWDIAEAHRILIGGSSGDPAAAYAVALARPSPTRPAGPPDLFDHVDPEPADPDALVDEAGALLRRALDDTWRDTDPRTERWAHLALDVAAAQTQALTAIGPRAVTLAHSESMAAVLALELQRDGLPVDRRIAERLVAQAAGPRPKTTEDAARIRSARDAEVLRHVPGRDHVDLRNPLQVKELLGSVGIAVTTTRAGELEPYRHTHPVVDALLTWRKNERIATTYGYRWLDEHVGPDDRLRGEWSACDGGAGRMTAGSGLHSLPVGMREAVVAEPGHTFVRADLGQIEPRVLAVVAGDERLAAATQADDLYAPVAHTLGVERSVAKVAFLSAMYGGQAGQAAAVLAQLRAAYPRAVATLDRAERIGAEQGELRTWGGRRLPLGWGDYQHALSRGRFARNAIIQGAAAELFKAWMATLRHDLRGTSARIVLCLHDEVLVHAPQEQAAQVADAMHSSLDAASRRWSGGMPVRFVADVRAMTSWAEAK